MPCLLYPLCSSIDFTVAMYCTVCLHWGLTQLDFVALQVRGAELVSLSLHVFEIVNFMVGTEHHPPPY